MNLLKSRAFAIAAALLIVATYVVSQLEVKRDPRPLGSVDDIRALAERDDVNVLFVLIDTLRSDRLGVYGYERETSPGMDYLARSGVRFANHRAQSSWTKSSMASIWTGLYPKVTGVERFDDALSDEARTPAELMQEAGFFTGGIWRNGWVAPNFNFQQGFDLYQNPGANQAPADVRREARAGRIEGTDIDVVFTFQEFLRANHDRRFFAYVHLMDVHQYVTVEELSTFGTGYSDFYDASILWTDMQVRALTGALEQHGLRDDTIVIVASDHGEAFGEHRREGHARDLHPEVTLTPFIVSFPFRLEPGLVIEDATENVDIWPTILEILGLPEMQPADGESRLAAILGEPRSEDTEATVGFLDRTWGRMSADPDPILSLRQDDLRIIYPTEDPERSLLFDLAADPGERRPLAPDHPEMERMRALAKQETERPVAWSSGGLEVEVDDLSLKQLRALGYVIE